MKIILSRKGIDGGNCKASNLVVYDEFDKSEIIMIPIPNLGDKTAYEDIKLSKHFDTYVKNYLNKHGIKPYSHCHLDPNISNYYNNFNFLGSFGQVGASQKHLENQKIEVGDLFIFFGKFEFHKISKLNIDVVMKNKHVMFGYLQINEIIYPNKMTTQERDVYEKKYPWLSAQPHWNIANYKKRENNCIYIAREKCSFDDSVKGYGVFEFNKDLILTKKNGTASQWKLPRPLRNLKISYHDRSNHKLTYFQSAKRGQEFVVEENKKAQKWVMNLIKNHAIKGGNYNEMSKM